MTLHASRAQILDAVRHADFNPLACRVARAVADYELAFAGEARRCGSFDYIRLPAPTDEIESVALDIFLTQMRRQMAGVVFKIKGDAW
jgi:hypothetical protein